MGLLRWLLLLGSLLLDLGFLLLRWFYSIISKLYGFYNVLQLESYQFYCCSSKGTFRFGFVLYVRKVTFSDHFVNYSVHFLVFFSQSTLHHIFMRWAFTSWPLYFSLLWKILFNVSIFLLLCQAVCKFLLIGQTHWLFV